MRPDIYIHNYTHTHTHTCGVWAQLSHNLRTHTILIFFQPSTVNRVIKCDDSISSVLFGKSQLHKYTYTHRERVRDMYTETHIWYCLIAFLACHSARCRRIFGWQRNCRGIRWGGRWLMRLLVILLCCIGACIRYATPHSFNHVFVCVEISACFETRLEFGSISRFLGEVFALHLRARPIWEETFNHGEVEAKCRNTLECMYT